MTQGLLKSIASVLLLVALIGVVVVNVWQSDRTERNQIALLDRVTAIEKTLENGGGARGGAASQAPAGGIFGDEPAYMTEAFRDPANMLVRDGAWLPSVAKAGGTLNIKFGSDPKGFNFLAENGADVQEIQKYVGMFLIKYHREDPGKKAADFAYSLVVSDDKKTFTFKLRQDVWWHAPAIDNTDPRFAGLQGDHKVTAHDVKFMMDMLMNTQVSGAAPGRSYFESLESYRVIDDHSFEIKWTEAKYTHLMIMHDLFPLPEFLYAFDEDGNRYDDSILGQRFQDHWYNPRALGCGPYRFVEFEPGVKIVLERDPRYPIGGNAFDKILIRILKDQNAWARLLRTGELDLSQLQPGQYRSEVLEGPPDSPYKDGTLQEGEFWTHSYFYIGWNSDKPWFGDKRVRWAMSHAYNADLLLDEVFLGLGARCTGPMATINAPYYDTSLPPIPFDLVRASELLEEAGWHDSNGNGTRDKMIDGALVEFEFDLTVYGSSDEYKTLGNIYKEDLAKIGVTMNVRPMEWSNLLKRVDDREFDAVTLAWVSSPDVDFYQIWHSTQADIPKGSNRVGFRNPKADEIIEALQREFDYDERVKLANQFHRLVYDEQPYTFFYTRQRKVYWQRDLENVQFSKTRPYMNPRPWFLARPDR